MLLYNPNNMYAYHSEIMMRVVYYITKNKMFKSSYK